MKHSMMISIAAVFLLTACNQPKTNTVAVQHSDTAMNMHSNHKTEKLFANVVFDDRYDLSCGMPLSAGITDTAHYQKKVYGFCSPECKADFIKDPKKLLSSKKSK